MAFYYDESRGEIMINIEISSAGEGLEPYRKFSVNVNDTTINYGLVEELDLYEILFLLRMQVDTAINNLSVEYDIIIDEDEEGEDE